tara:strand:- start:784 stop:1032 length:249 start_codon:yes stop_codon:yes gene_type:complete
MLRFILYTLLFWVIFSLFSSFFKSKKKSYDGSRENLLEDEMISCANCQTYFPSKTAFTFNFFSKEKKFCSKECMESFDAGVR